MKNYNEILKNCILFKDISEDELQGLLSCLGARVVCFDKSYTVFAEGSRAKYLGILLCGSVQVIQIDYYGNRSIISSPAVGEVFAEEFACAGISEIPVSVIANEESEIMLIDCDRILHTCQKGCGFHQRIIYNLMQVLAYKNISFHKKIDITSKRSTRDKLLTYLMHEAKKATGNEFEIPFDRQELADYLEVDRSGLSAEISKLRREGAIECRKNKFMLL